MELQQYKITPQDLSGVGVIGLPDTPGLSAQDMQAKLEETARQLIVPRFNAALQRADEELGQRQTVAAAAADKKELEDKIEKNAQGIAEANTAIGQCQTTAAAAADKKELEGKIGANAQGLTDAQAALAQRPTREAVQQMLDEQMQAIGAGDMTKAVYDPQGVASDIFAAASATATGRVQLSDTPAAQQTADKGVAATPAAVAAAKAAADSAATAAAAASTAAAAASKAAGTAQTSADAKVPTTRKVNDHPLSADVTVTKADVGLGNVDNAKQMPIAGGTFTGIAYAQNANNNVNRLRNILVKTTSANVSTNYILMVRK